MSGRGLPERIVTARLLLRRPVESDAHGIFTSYAQDPLVSRFLLWRPHTSEEATREFVRACLHAWEHGSRRPYVITEAGSSSAIGIIEARPEGDAVELGYVLARACWGRGYMPEAIRAVAAEALDRDCGHVQAVCDVENLQSQRALEKAGFRRAERRAAYLVHPNVSPEPRDCFLYVMPA